MVLSELVSQLPFRSTENLVAFHSHLGQHRSVAMAELFAGVCTEAGLTTQLTHVCCSHWSQSRTGCGGCKDCQPDAPGKLRSANRDAFVQALVNASQKARRA